MPKRMRHVGLDVHSETIAVAVAEPDGSVRELGTIRNRPESVRKLVAKLGGARELRVCYEAGPTGYPLYWQLTALGVHCDVIAPSLAPSLVPTRAGDRVKTDRKDAARLARCYRAGDLTAVWVPDAATEALRDLVRAREVAKQDQLRARHRVSKFLLRHGQHRPGGMRAWTLRHAQWLARLTFESPTLQVVYDEYRASLDLVADRVRRLERAIEAAVSTLAPVQQRPSAANSWDSSGPSARKSNPYRPQFAPSMSPELTIFLRSSVGRWAGTERHTRHRSMRSSVLPNVQLASLVCGCARRITILRYAHELTRAYQSDQPSRTASHRAPRRTPYHHPNRDPLTGRFISERSPARNAPVDHASAGWPRPRAATGQLVTAESSRRP
jgi:hypothetical protein